MQLLFVEDDEGQLDLFQDAVKDWNTENPAANFEVTSYKAVDEAKAALRFKRFDAPCLIFGSRPASEKAKAVQQEATNSPIWDCRNAEYRLRSLAATRKISRRP